MCGRLVQGEGVAHTVMFGSMTPSGDLPGPNYNVRPTDQIRIIVDTPPPDPATASAVPVEAHHTSTNAWRDDEARPRIRRVASARWSLIPPFAKERKLPYPTFNARSETAAQKPAFRASVAQKRCLIPVDGYYEWLTDEDSLKHPYYIYPEQDGIVLAFAGLYSWWVDPAADPEDPARWVLSATILTMPAVPRLSHIHDRSPIILPPQMWDAWLAPYATGDQLLMDAAVASTQSVADHLGYYEVPPLRGNGPELLAPIRSSGTVYGDSHGTSHSIDP